MLVKVGSAHFWWTSGVVDIKTHQFSGIKYLKTFKKTCSSLKTTAYLYLGWPWNSEISANTCLTVCRKCNSIIAGWHHELPSNVELVLVKWVQTYSVSYSLVFVALYILQIREQLAVKYFNTFLRMTNAWMWMLVFLIQINQPVQSITRSTDNFMETDWNNLRNRSI